VKKIFLIMLLLVCGLSFAQSQKKVIQYAIIISETSINQTIVNGVMAGFLKDTTTNTVISTMTTNAKDIMDLKNDIDIYGNDMDNAEWVIGHGMPHGFAWAILARYANDRDIDLDDTYNFIDHVLYNNKQYILIRIYK